VPHVSGKWLGMRGRGEQFARGRIGKFREAGLAESSACSRVNTAAVPFFTTRQVVYVPEASFEVTRGNQLLTPFMRPGGPVVRSFCATCGSKITNRLPDKPQLGVGFFPSLLEEVPYCCPPPLRALIAGLRRVCRHGPFTGLLWPPLLYTIVSGWCYSPWGCSYSKAVFLSACFPRTARTSVWIFLYWRGTYEQVRAARLAARVSADAALPQLRGHDRPGEDTGRTPAKLKAPSPPSARLSLSARAVLPMASELRNVPPREPVVIKALHGFLFWIRVLCNHRT